MKDYQVALLAAAITCGPDALPSVVADTTERYIIWLRTGAMGE